MKLERLYQLDLIRFVAALYVVFYHYCFRGYNRDSLSQIRYESLESFSKYGYLGVDLFFIISGFVILMSALNSNVITFIISRISRLYPAYWVCLILTSSVILIFGADKFGFTPFVFFANLTMLNGFFKIDFVDGVYWSLLVELKFYIIIGLLLLLKKIKYLIPLIYLWLLISLYFLYLPKEDWNLSFTLISYFFIPDWCSYFIAGMTFFLIKKDGKVLKRLPILIISLFLSLSFATLKANQLNSYYDGLLDVRIVCTFIIGFYLLFFLLVVDKLKFLNNPLFLRLGILTYPLYLLHQNIGYISFNFFNGKINEYIILVIILLLMIIVSYYISTLIEKPLGNFIKQSLKNNTIIKKHNTY